MISAGLSVRHTEPDDYEAIQRIMSGSKAFAGTLQMPLPSKEKWRRKLSEPPQGLYSLVACIEDEPVGTGSIMTYPNRPRMKHVGDIGLTVRDDWQGKGVGSKLMESLLDLADNWLALTRVELEVYTDNVAAIALYGKFGFEMEGTLKRKAFRNGVYVDNFVMARLRVTSAGS